MLITHVFLDGLLDLGAGLADFGPSLVHGGVEEVAQGLSSGNRLGCNCGIDAKLKIFLEMIFE